jgi:two-component system KDP operon response regulator KdpE
MITSTMTGVINSNLVTGRKHKKNKQLNHKYVIMLVDDEERILYFLKTKLKMLGYEIITATNGVEALEELIQHQPDLVVLDVIMPKMDGFQTLKQLRTISTIPVIMLSAMGDDSNRIKGLGLGADDYLSKPFNPDELVARIEAIKRRLNLPDRTNTPKKLEAHGLQINFDEHRLLVRGSEVKLTRVEWLLLHQLASNAGHLMVYYDLLARVWGPEYRDDVQILRTWVSRLRQKLEVDPASPQIISTVPKTGYIFNNQKN